MFADTKFADSFDKSCAEDPISVHSRTGFVMKCAGFPIVWKSKLQSEIFFSTMETECIALSTALREAIPLMHLLKDFSTVVSMCDWSKTMNCAVLRIIMAL